MYSCDCLLLSKIMVESSYKELSLINGIANYIRTVSYGNSEIVFPDGRGYIDYTYTLDKHNIQYEILTIAELKKQKDFSNIIVLVPKEYLDYQEKVNKNVTQLAIIYSAFEVKRIADEKITLELVENRWTGYSKEIPIAYFEMLEEVFAKPLGYLIKVVRVKQKTLNLSKDEIRMNIQKNAVNCLTNSEFVLENTKCTSGVQFYSLLENKIMELIGADMSIPKNRVAVFMFVSALNAGGAAFYRRDFADALIEGEYLDLRAISCVEAYFEEAIKAWEELRRILRFLQKGDKTYITEEKIHTLLGIIKKNELSVFEILGKEA